MPPVTEIHLPEWKATQEISKNRFGRQVAGTDAMGRAMVIQHLDPLICPDFLWKTVQQAAEEPVPGAAHLFLPWVAGRAGGEFALGEPARNGLSFSQALWTCQMERLTERGRREIYLEVMRPLLMGCQAALAQVKQPERISLAPDHVFVVFPETTPLPRLSAEGVSGGRWPDFEIRFRPFCLRSLLPASVEDGPQRLAWLKAPATRRFAGLVYQLFQGETWEEGCPQREDYKPTPLLGRAANHALSRALVVREGALSDQLETLALESIFEVEEVSAPVPRRQVKPHGGESAPVPAPAVPANLGAKTRTPARGQPQSPRPIRWGRLVGVFSVLACGFGTVAWLALRDRPTVSDALVPNQPAPTPPETAAQTEKSPAPAAPARPTPPAPPSEDILTTANRLLSTGQAPEAIRILLAAAAAPTPVSEALPYLQAAAQASSPVAFLQLGEASRASNPAEAAKRYGEAWTLIRSGKPIPPGPYASEAAQCLTQLKQLNAGDVLLSLARVPAGNPLRQEALDLYAAAAAAYRQSGALGPANPRQATAVAATLTALATSQLSTQRADAIAGLLTATQCDSYSPALIWNSDFIETLTPAENRAIQEKLVVYINQNNATAMVALANLISPDNPNPTELNRRNLLLDRAARLNQPDALFMQAQAILSSSAAFGGAEASPAEKATAFDKLLQAAELGSQGAFSMLRSPFVNSALGENQRLRYGRIQPPAAIRNP